METMLLIILGIELLILGGLIGELIGYKSGFKKAIQQTYELLGNWNGHLKDVVIFCAECNRALPLHSNGCEVAKKFNLLINK